MESYRFEFYNEETDNYLHFITFSANITEEDIHAIFELCRKGVKPTIEETFKWYLEPTEHSNIECSKKKTGYTELVRRKNYLENNANYEDFQVDHCYLIYFTYGIWTKNNDNFERFLYVAEKNKSSTKIVYQHDESNDDEDYGCFQITLNSELFFSKEYSDKNEKSNQPVLRCTFTELFKILMNIDSIKNEADIKKVLIKRR